MSNTTKLTKKHTLTDEEIKNIILLTNKGIKPGDIVTILNVGYASICRVIRYTEMIYAQQFTELFEYDHRSHLRLKQKVLDTLDVKVNLTDFLPKLTEDTTAQNNQIADNDVNNYSADIIEIKGAIAQLTRELQTQTKLLAQLIKMWGGEITDV